MKKLNMVSKLGMAAVVGAALVSGVTALSGTTALAARQPPRLDCGPTRLWICVLPGCPDCYDVQFEGTICEKNQYEQSSGRKCSPEGN